MQIHEVVTKMQTRLLMNDQLIKQLEDEREDVLSWQADEQSKIEKHFQDVLKRLETARNSLLSQVEKEAKKRQDACDLKEQRINSACLALSPELITIQQVMMDEREMAEFDVSGCWDRVQSLLAGQDDQDSDEKFPPAPFIPSPSLTKLKKADFGFLRLADYLPQDFLLILTSSPGPGSLATCSVVTPMQFSSKVQANIQFSIKQEGSKTVVPFCREECQVAEDRKSFQIVFPVTKPGVFLVTVLLYGQHVQHSPLSVHVLGTNTTKQDGSIPPSSLPAVISSTISLSPSTTTSPSTTVTCSSYTTTTSSSSTTNLTAICPSQKTPKLSKPVLPGKPRQPNIVTHIRKTRPDQESGTDFLLLVGAGRVVEDVTMKIPAATETKCGKSTLTMPIGMCILHNKEVAVASTFEDKVKIFSSSGKFVKLVKPGTHFNHPSDMLTLRSGQFVVRDDASIQFFTAEGKYIRSLDTTHINKCYGMTEDEEGLLVTINENKGTAWRRGKEKKEDMKVADGGTKIGETDLLFFDVETGELVKKMEMADIIKDKQRSKCRFLTSWQGKLLITDLGMDCVYTLDLATKGVAVCGKTGSGPGCFSDPAGLVVDSKGNWLVADSRNHRLCVYTGQGAWVGEVRLRPGARRPSGLTMDKDTGDVYLLNLQGKWAMIRYSTGVGVPRL